MALLCDKRKRRQNGWPIRWLLYGNKSAWTLFKEYLFSGGWWHEEVEKSRNPSEFLGRYGGSTWYMMAVIVLVFVLLIAFTGYSCDNAAYSFFDRGVSTENPGRGLREVKHD